VKPASTSHSYNPFETPGGIGRLLLVLLAVVIAVPLMGYWIGTGQTLWLIFAAVVALAIFVIAGLRRRAWLLVPFSWALIGQIGILPVPFSVRDMVVLLIFATWLANAAFTKDATRFRWHALDWILLINFAWLAYTYYLHPVGVRAASSELYGGRYYWNFLIAGMAYWVIIRLPTSPKQVRWLPHFWLGGQFVLFVLNAIVYAVPSLTPVIFMLYTDVSTETFLPSGGVFRLGSFGAVGAGLIRFLCSLFSPISLLNPLRFRFYALLFGLVCALTSGFRGVFVVIATTFLLGSMLRRRYQDVVLGAVAGIALLTALIFGQGRFFHLSQSVQRTLSFLPGAWEQEVVEEAKGSAEWRFQLWRDILTYRMINDWWRGDGFGIEQQDFELTRRNSSEALVLRGAYHSGPLTAIRNVGIVGLALFYLLLISGAWYSVRLVKMFNGTALYPVAIFAALYLVWQPIHYAFVFGAYPNTLPDVIFNVAIVRLLISMKEHVPSIQEGVNPERAATVPRLRSSP
jgi:hypothetical protein